GSVADNAGIQKKDLIVEIDGKPITYHDQVTPVIKAFSGDTLRFSVIRNGERINFKEYFKGATALGFWPMEDENFTKNAEVKIKYGFFESIPLGTERAF